MANADSLDKAYATIGSLLAKGVTKLSVQQVAAASGLARQTFYQQDDEWKEVRAVIKGKPSTRVKLVQVEIKQKSESAKRLEALLGRVEDMEQELTRVEGIASTVYKELIDEVQRWFYKASETPKKKIQVAQYIEELNSTRKELERVMAENRLLKAEHDGSDTLPKLNQKRTIDLAGPEEIADILNDFLRQYKALVPTQRMTESLSAVYILCGLPCSGKTTWIKKHHPKSQGLHIYVDSCAHQAQIRRFIANQIQSSSNAEVHCVWIRTDLQTCSDRSEKTHAGAENALKQEEIKATMQTFQAPTLDEPFTSVILA